MEDDDFVNTVVELHEKGEWKKILALNEHSDNENARNLLWVWPSEENLKFIQENVLRNEIKGIISLGCGCGLLEWVMEKSINVPVMGFEVNKEWWDSRYSNPQFIKLQYPVIPLEKNLSENHALLFCYFNNEEAFLDYVNHYNGNVIFIIGPGKGRGTHTNPQPFSPNFQNPQWRLHCSQEVKDTKDFIAVYIKQN